MFFNLGISSAPPALRSHWVNSVSFSQRCLPAAPLYSWGFCRGVRACGESKGDTSEPAAGCAHSCSISSHHLPFFFLWMRTAESCIFLEGALDRPTGPVLLPVICWLLVLKGALHIISVMWLSPFLRSLVSWQAGLKLPGTEGSKLTPLVCFPPCSSLWQLLMKSSSRSVALAVWAHWVRYQA